MTTLEPKYTLFDSLDQMLAPDTLSELLSRPVTRVAVQPMEHNGLAGSQLSNVETDAGRFVLKQMSLATDFGMIASNDRQCRAVTLWQYGYLDQLKPRAHHKIMACAREGNRWAILMEDLGGSVFHGEKNPITPDLLPSLLDTLARLHATFWNQTELKDEKLGLLNLADLISLTSRSSGEKLKNQPEMGVVLAWINSGWEAMAELLDGEVFRQMLALVENPEPVLKAVARYPFTLVHGDFRPDNMAFTEHFIIFDWQVGTYSLMTIDLAWLTKNIRDLIDKERADQIYRERLETHLNQQFEDAEWQAMVDLGYAMDALRVTCLDAGVYKFAENPDDREAAKKLVNLQAQRVMDALRWL